MTTYAILIQNRVAAMNVDAYNRSAIAGSDVDLQNGSVFRLDTLEAGSSGCEVWAVTAPATSTSTLNNLWMAYSPEVNTLVSGTKMYRGLSPDPRDFYNAGAYVFDAFKPQVGDIVTLTADAFTSAISSNTYLNAANGVYTLTPGASQTASALSLQLIDTTYVSLADGSISTQRVTAYKFVVLAN